MEIKKIEEIWKYEIFWKNFNKLKSLKVVTLKDKGCCEGGDEGGDKGGDEDGDEDDDEGSDEDLFD